MNSQATIVVLEDERPQLLLLQAALDDAGNVAAFSDPVAALDFLKAQPADVALIDIGLGAHAIMDGLDFIRAVRRFDGDLSIIIRTGNDTVDLADQAIELGAFRRSIKTKQPIDQLRKLTRAAIEETRNRRRLSRNAATSADIREELGAALGTMDEEQAVGDTYHAFLHGMRNQVTALAGMAELICRESNTPAGREHALRNRALVAGVVSEIDGFLDAPLTRSQIASHQTEASANNIIETIRRRFAVSASSVSDGKTLKVSGLIEDLFVAGPPLRLLAAIRHIVEFCWDRTPAGSKIVLSTKFSERVQQELDVIREEKLVFARSHSARPVPSVAFRVVGDLVETSINKIREAFEEYSENPRRGCLHSLGTFVDTTGSVLVAYQSSATRTVFELYVPISGT